MKKILQILFLSCLKATELIEKKFYFRLSVREKLQLKMHKMMCEACTNYEKQSNVLDKALGKSAKPHEISPDLEKFKKDILAKIEKTN